MVRSDGVGDDTEYLHQESGGTASWFQHLAGPSQGDNNGLDCLYFLVNRDTPIALKNLARL